MVVMRRVYLLVVFALLANRAAVAALSSAMIVEMREITSVSVSPSGQLAVVGICHSNPRTNKRETSWLVVPLREGGTLKAVSAGEEIYDPSAPGALLSRKSLWPPHGEWVLFLRWGGEAYHISSTVYEL